MKTWKEIKAGSKLSAERVKEIEAAAKQEADAASKTVDLVDVDGNVKTVSVVRVDLAKRRMHVRFPLSGTWIVDLRSGQLEKAPRWRLAD